MWLALSALFAVFVRSTALIPVDEPARSLFRAEADHVALGFFAAAAVPGVLVIGLLTIWQHGRRR